MATSKPYAGNLSTGHRYLVCTTTADAGGKRSPLTIAGSKPSDSLFSQAFVIRTSDFDNTPGVYQSFCKAVDQGCSTSVF